MSTENPVTGGAEAGEVLRGWFGGRLPEDWFAGVPEIKADREEITVVGVLPDTPGAAESSPAEAAAAADGRSQALSRGDARPADRDRQRS